MTRKIFDVKVVCVKLLHGLVFADHVEDGLCLSEVTQITCQVQTDVRRNDLVRDVTQA